MKESAGLSKLAPGLMVFVCFITGSALQTVSMRNAGMSSNYIIVLGLEAALALALGIAMFGESLSPSKAVGVLLVALGVALLRAP